MAIETNRYGKSQDTINTNTTSFITLSFPPTNATIVAQDFLAASNYSLTYVRFQLQKTGTPTGTITCKLYGAGANPTAGSLLATASNTVAYADIGAAVLVNFVFSTPIALTSGQQYYAVLEVSGVSGNDASNYMRVLSSTTSTYATGNSWSYYSGSWNANTNDLYLITFSIADGGNFDLSTTTANAAALTALKGGSVPHSTDNIFVYNGATLTVDTGDNLACTLITLGDMSTGAAVAGQKYGIVQCNAGSTITFAGNATNTNSGIKSNPTTPGAESTGCRVILNGTSASHITFTNSVGALNTNNKYYPLNMTYGYVTGGFVDFQYFWGTVTTIPGSSTRATAGTVLTDCTTTPNGMANTVNNIVDPINLAMDYRRWTVDIGNAASCAFWGGTQTTFTSGGSFDSTGLRATGTFVASTFSPGGTIKNHPFYGGQRYAFADIRPTTVVPTGLAFTDPQTNGELRFTITNAASYASTDEIVIYNNSGGALMACIPISRYNSLGYGIVTGLTNDTLYTMYAKATSDNNTYSDASSTATGTPTKLNSTDPGEANVLDDVTYYIDNVLKTGTLVADGISITALSVAGTTVTLTLSGAGATQGTGFVKIFDVVGNTFVCALSITAWSNTSVAGTILRTLAAGTYRALIVNNAGTSGTRQFSVTEEIQVITSPSDPIKQRILDAVAWGMTQITTDAGYYNTIRRVYDQPRSLDDIAEFPSVIVDEGPEECANASAHLQTGGNEALLHNQMDVRLDCVVQNEGDPAYARNKILADVQRYFGLHYSLPGEDGTWTAHDAIYLRSEPWGTDETRPLTGVTAYFRVWYRQYLTNPTQRG